MFCRDFSFFYICQLYTKYYAFYTSYTYYRLNIKSTVGRLVVLYMVSSFWAQDKCATAFFICSDMASVKRSGRILEIRKYNSSSILISKMKDCQDLSIKEDQAFTTWLHMYRYIRFKWSHIVLMPNVQYLFYRGSILCKNRSTSMDKSSRKVRHVGTRGSV